MTNQRLLRHVVFDVFDVDDELRNEPPSKRWGGTYYRGSFEVNLEGGQVRKSPPQKRPPQKITTAPIHNLRENVQKLLGYKNPKQELSCGEAVQRLIDAAAAKFPKWKNQNSKTFMEAFDRIAGQGGFVPEIDVAHFGGTVDGDAFASQDPGHGARPAVGQLHPFQAYGPINDDQAQLYYALVALHETFHLAARGGYGDEDMAKVVAELTGWKLPPPGSEVLTFSNFWDHYLMDHCRVDSLKGLK